MFGLLAMAVVAACGGEEAQPSAEERASRGRALTADQVCFDGDPLCTPTGAHQTHAAYACSTCHKVAGRLAFDAAGPAYGAALPRPTFDAAAKTCSNVACHGVPSGSYSYWFQGGDGEPQLNTVTYGGGGAATPGWYASGSAGCTGCHGNPPRNGNWHSGLHGGQGPTGTRNQCQFCHPGQSSPGNGVGDTITNPALHRNGVVEVQARFVSGCYDCH